MGSAQKRTTEAKSNSTQTTTKKVQTPDVNPERRGFLRTVSLGTLGTALGVETLAKLTGCGDTIHNVTHNHYGPDGGPKPDTMKPDTQLPDTLSPDTCTPVSTSVQCSTDPNSVLAAGVVNQGESLNIDNTYRLIYEDYESHGGTVYAIVSLTDTCGNILNKDKIKEGETKLFSVSIPEEETTKDILEVKLEKVNQGYNTSTNWVKLNVKSPCNTVPETCVPDKTPLTCNDNADLVSGTLSQGESLVLGPLRLQLDDLVSSNVPLAAISFKDSCGNVYKKDTIEKGETKVYFLKGKQIKVTANNVVLGYTFGAKWADLSVKVPCTSTYWCPSVMGLVNQGESLSMGSLKYRLDDVMLQGGKAYALISVLDQVGTVGAKLKIEEGKSEEFMNLKIAAPTVAMGATFGAKWAKIEVYGKFSKPCGS
jgi:hypothetical protein